MYLFCQFCLKCYFSVHCGLKVTFKPWANSFIISTFMSIVEMLHIYCDVSGYICIYMHLYVICLYDLLEKHQLNQVLMQSITYIWMLSDTSNYFLVISPQLKFSVLSLRLSYTELFMYTKLMFHQNFLNIECQKFWHYGNTQSVYNLICISLNNSKVDILTICLLIICNFTL